jgi:hypothetical protein
LDGKPQFQRWPALRVKKSHRWLDHIYQNGGKKPTFFKFFLHPLHARNLEPPQEKKKKEKKKLRKKIEEKMKSYRQFKRMYGYICKIKLYGMSLLAQLDKPSPLCCDMASR